MKNNRSSARRNVTGLALDWLQPPWKEEKKMYILYKERKECQRAIESENVRIVGGRLVGEGEQWIELELRGLEFKESRRSSWVGVGERL